jgi:hypothetical protein
MLCCTALVAGAVACTFLDPCLVKPSAWREYGLKSGKNGHLARPNGAVDGPYCSRTLKPWPSVCTRRCEPLISRGGGFGGGAAPAPTRDTWGASSIRLTKKNARCQCQAVRAWPGRDAWLGWLSYAACSRAGGPARRRKAVALPRLPAASQTPC